MKSILTTSFILSAGIFLIITASLLYFSLNRNDGKLIYALDDPYIHMAMAKNMARHFVWGVTSSEFSSSASSLLWTAIVSFLYLILGINESLPFILNILCALSLLFIADRLLEKQNFSLPCRLSILIGIIFLTPLPPLAFTGMEHILQTILVILYLHASSESLGDASKSAQPRCFIPLLTLAVLMTLIRYESLFLISITSVLFFIKGRRKFAILLLLSGLAPALIYGLISIVKGWYFLPNPVLLKANIRGIDGWPDLLNLFGLAGLKQIWHAPHILTLLIISILVYFVGRIKGFWNRGQLLLILWILTVALHMQFARTGWFYRYEAYLVVSGILILAGPIKETIQVGIISSWNNRRKGLTYTIFALLFLVSIIFLGKRSYDAFRWTALATSNIYQQQYQMGLFLGEFYEGKPIAANDVGAICYLADIKCLDLWGAADMEVARCKKENRFDAEKIRLLAESKHVQIVIIYDHWFIKDGINKIPSEWIKIGIWRISDNIVCGGDSVSFYSVDSLSGNILIQNLRQFSSRLPAGIVQRGMYLD